MVKKDSLLSLVDKYQKNGSGDPIQILTLASQIYVEDANELTDDEKDVFGRSLAFVNHDLENDEMTIIEFISLGDSIIADIHQMFIRAFIQKILFARLSGFMDSSSAEKLSIAILDDIVTDVEECADPDNWTSEDVDIALERLLLKKFSLES